MIILRNSNTEIFILLLEQQYWVFDPLTFIEKPWCFSMMNIESALKCSELPNKGDHLRKKVIYILKVKSPHFRKLTLTVKDSS